MPVFLKGWILRLFHEGREEVFDLFFAYFVTDVYSRREIKTRNLCEVLQKLRFTYGDPMKYTMTVVP